MYPSVDHHIRDTNQPTSWGGTTLDFPIQHRAARLISQDHRQQALKRGGLDWSRGILRSRFPKQRARCGAHMSKL